MPASKELLDQLDAAERQNESMQAWFQLKGDEPGEAAPSPQATQTLAKELVQRASDGSGEEPEKVQVLEQLGSIRVKARPNFLRLLSSQPEVLAARATNLPGLDLIRPVKAEPVTLAGPSKKTIRRKQS